MAIYHNSSLTHFFQNTPSFIPTPAPVPPTAPIEVFVSLMVVSVNLDTLVSIAKPSCVILDKIVTERENVDI